MENGSILSVKNLRVEIGDEKIIDDLSFEVKEGQTFVILGPNGAGKTVLLRTLLGFLPFSGEIKWRPDVKIGYVPQRLPFIKDMPLSVEEFLKLKNRVSDEQIVKFLESVGLKNSSMPGRGVGVLSSGQFQRILVARALVGDPQVLLFDEPTAGIDIGGEETIYGLLAKLKKEKGLTIFLVTHDLNIVYKEADNVLCLNHKRVCYGLPKEVLTSENLVKLFGGDVNFYKHESH